MSGSIEIVEADLERPDHQQAVVELTAAYALDPMGNDGPLSTDVLERLIPSLRAHPTTLIFLAYADGKPVGIATCFGGFSTFLAQPLINVHDLAILPDYRGRGIGRQLLRSVESKARQLGCGKLTLEVVEHNAPARRLYARVGFTHAGAESAGGGSLFYSKTL